MIWDLLEESTFDLHFSSPNLDINTLLLDENIITQFKNLNPKLLHFVQSNKDAFLRTLLQYTTVMPQVEQGHDRCHKLPYISSELLSINSPLIYSDFFKERKYWDILLGLLESPSLENEVLLGYFEKVVCNLYQGNKLETTTILHGAISPLLNALHYQSIADILKKTIVLISIPEGALLQLRKDILTRIIHHILTADQTTKSNGVDVLVQAISKFQTFSSGDALLQHIWNTQSLLSFYCNTSSNSVAEFIIGYLNKAKQLVLNELDQHEHIMVVAEIHKQKADAFIKGYMQFAFTSSAEVPVFHHNQMHVPVRKLKKQVSTFLTLANLAIENQISGFLSEWLVLVLWNLASEHPFNDILLVSIIKLFIEIGKSELLSAQCKFKVVYHSKMLELATKNIKMYRPHIYRLWRACHNLGSPACPQLSQYWVLLEKELNELVQYDIPKQQQSHNSKPAKLIVDEEDSNYAAAKQEVKNQQVALPIQQEAPAHPKSNFDMFSAFQENIHEAQQKTQFAFTQNQFTTKKTQKVSDLFGEFTLETENSSSKQQKSEFDAFADFI